MPGKLLKIGIFLVLVKSLIWMFLIPIFQIPDEPSHLAIVEFLAEHGRRPHPRREVVTPVEVMRVAEIVNFNWQINHPVWRGYSSGWLEQLQNLDQSLRQQLISNDYQTSLKRPPLYYYSAVPFYFLGGTSFLGRFFAVRFLSIIFHLLTVWLAYQAAKKVFKSLWLGLAVASLIAFQPTLSFLSVGVHYDPLAVLTVTAFIYFIVYSRRFLSWGTALLGILVKPDLIFLPLLKLKLRWLMMTILALLFGLAALAGPLVSLISRQQLGGFDRFLYFTNINEYSSLARFFLESLAGGQLFIQLKNYWLATAAIHWAQIFPWYWGTFGWLEAPLPGWVFSAIKLLVLLSLLGWIRFIHRHGWPRKMSLWLGLVFLQAAVVVANDFQFFARTGSVYGIQGRYFFPAIAAQMILLVFGLRQWLGEKLLAQLIFGLSLGLNLLGLVTVYQYFGNVWR